MARSLPRTDLGPLPGHRARRRKPRRSPTTALRTDPVLWLSTVGADGRPHLVPLWFVWDGERIVAFSKPKARKVENLRGDPRAMVAVGTPGPAFDVELIEARSELRLAPGRRAHPAALRR